jgi:hypothetical protein
MGAGVPCNPNPCPNPPANDDCFSALPVPVPSSTPGDTTFAQFDAAPFCGAIEAPGVWYSVVGAGTNLTAALCDGQTAYDAKLSVYSGGCTGLQCATFNDDSCGLQPSVTWCAASGVTYFILVHGYDGAVGPFVLNVTDDGQPCSGPCGGVRGDANCDGTVNFFDIDPFLTALFNLPTYLGTFCDGSICAVDIDCSGNVDFFDIDPFLNCLFLTCPSCP